MFTADFVDAIKVPGNIIVPGTGIVPGFPTQPNICGIMGLVSAGSAFSNQVASDANALAGQISGAASEIGSIPQSILDQISFDAQGLVNTLENQALSAASSFAVHAAGQIANLIPNLNLATGQLALQMGLLNSGCALPSAGNIGAPGTDPCSLMGSFFNSIMGAGAALIGGAAAALGQVSSLVSSLLNAASSELQGIADQITAAIGSVANIASSMTSMIAGEASQLASALADVIGQANIGQLFGMMVNPCSAAVITANATAEAQQYLTQPSLPPASLIPAGG